MGAPIADFIDRLQRQRHPHPLRQRRRHDHVGGRADAQPEHGHPGVVELRAAAVRDERARRRADRRAAAALPRGRAPGRRGRPVRRVDRTGRSAPRAATTTATLAEIGDVYAATRDAGRPAHGDRHRRRSRLGATRRACRSSPWPPPTRRSSPTRSSAPPASARPLPAHLADLLDRPERTNALPDDLATVEHFVDPSAASRADVCATPADVRRPARRGPARTSVRSALHEPADWLQWARPGVPRVGIVNDRVTNCRPSRIPSMRPDLAS